MLELIKEDEDRKFKDVASLKNSALPTIMYGAGSYALDVTHFLKKHDIKLQAYTVDGAFLEKAPKAIDNKPVQAIEDALAKYAERNIVIGFADYVKAKEVLKNLGVTTNIYFIDAPNQYGFFDREYIVKNEQAFQAVYDKLADDKSRAIFIDFINAKISGDPNPLYKHADFNQYFGDPIQLTDNETLVDCGAYDGDTIASFLKNTGGSYKKIFTFEPDPKNFTKLQHYVTDSNLHDVTAVNAGCWSGATTLYFSSDANMATTTNADSDLTINTVCIDDVVGEESVTFIKMDIEGAELEALKGAQKTIKRDHPKLAICAYHKPEDLITLPQYILELSSDYKLYLRHHQYMSWEMVLYAI